MGVLDTRKDLEVKIKIDWGSTLAALAILATFLVFPLVNSCQSEDSNACTWHAEIQGNGKGNSFTDYYGLLIKH